MADAAPTDDHADPDGRRQRTMDSARQFPDQNPNPVLRISAAGELLYANDASDPIVRELGLRHGQLLPAGLLDPLRDAIGHPNEEQAEVEVGRRTYCFKPVSSPELGFINVYATDVSAARAVERFPERNPSPVLRISLEGELLYANAASEPIVSALGLVVGEPLPAPLWADLQAAEEPGATEKVQVKGDDRWFELVCVVIPEMDFANVYGRDVTALRALQRFPLQNPNPVIRVSREGRLLFANPASEHISAAFGLVEGAPAPDVLMAPIREGMAEGQCCFEVEAGERVYRLTAVAEFEFGFINIYGTDITAAKEVEAAHAENERLLLNILPEPIAQRLRDGEKIIADRHEDLSLLFADVVGFTQMSSNLPPERVIDLLDHLFRDLDELVEIHRLEKIKTIGDAYMAVGGLQPDDDDHLARAAGMALELNAALRRRREEQPIRMRIGLHAGPAVAGVIGTKKFIYDVWGDTVNTASRLEAFGEPECIQVTDAVQARLAERFEFEPRGIIDLKGMGPTRTWYLRGRKDGTKPEAFA